MYLPWIAASRFKLDFLPGSAAPKTHEPVKIINNERNILKMTRLRKVPSRLVSEQPSCHSGLIFKQGGAVVLLSQTANLRQQQPIADI